MRQTWRWFGPEDRVSLAEIRQAGAEGIVSALHHVPAGAVWPPEEIERRQGEVATNADGSGTGLQWEVVESLPVSEEIKRQSGAWREHVSAYRESLRNLASAGLKTVCYNFMPVLDWTRTDLSWPRPDGARCMRFDRIDFALFDIHLLQREGAPRDHPQNVVEEAAARHGAMSDEDRRHLADNIVCGLPGAAEHYDLAAVRDQLAAYDGISDERLRENFVAFLSEVAPVAQELGVKLCCHPDDPPFPLLGLPRVMSTEGDYAAIMQAVDVPANGITLCSGSLGARADNDLPGMMERLGARVHFLHLRNVTRDDEGLGSSFFEDQHLAGNTDMVALIAAVLAEEERRKAAGREDWSIPMRPDHGQDILDDLGRKAQPGYPAIGRLKGLAELRGVMRALSHPMTRVAP